MAHEMNMHAMERTSINSVICVAQLMFVPNDNDNSTEAGRYALAPLWRNSPEIWASMNTQKLREKCLHIFQDSIILAPAHQRIQYSYLRRT